MSSATTKTSAALENKPRAAMAPFLVWPVARREFYALIAFSLLLPMSWGIVIFGWRALAVVAATLTGAAAMHIALKRWTQRGKRLILAHTLMSAMLVGALAQGLWPPSLMMAAGMVMVRLIWLFGGPGHERVFASTLVVMLLALAVGWLGLRGGAGSSGAILAHDRLFMGDLAQSHVKRVHYFPRSSEIDGQDAVELPRTQVVVTSLLRDLRALVRQTAAKPLSLPRAEPPAVETAESTAPATQPVTARDAAETVLTTALVERLPSVEELLLGVTPGRIGAVSGLGIALGGLYLAYRNVLRPRSFLLFLAAVMAGLVISATVTRTQGEFGGIGYTPLTRVLTASEMVTLLIYDFFSGDILFAAVFILAMPGSEPVTSRGRRWFLLSAGIVAGLVHAVDLPVPMTALVLMAFQPLAPLFDRMLGRRSWLNAEP